MRHMENSGGKRHMDVDHFDPTLRGKKRDAYSNLMLATHHCNMMKNATWTKVAAGGAGAISLLNPCEERDYGKHLFEDAHSHELIGVSERGRLQIDTMDLNHPTFVQERRQRADYFAIKRGAAAYIKGSFVEVLKVIALADAAHNRCIPEIPPPPSIQTPKGPSLARPA